MNLTRRPAAYDRLLDRYPLVINGGVRDISKRRVSAQLVTRASGYAGPVIVKTDDNCFGAPDWSGVAWSGGLTALVSRVAERVLPVRRRIRERRTYPIYPSADRVPRAVWWDPRLVVERFLPERRDGFYCLRTWVFFGPRGIASLSLSREPVVKRVNVVESEFVAEVPEAIREARARLGFDYGKFDFVIHEGRPILLDTNPTPTCGPKRTARLDAIADELAPGLLELLAAPPRRPPGA